MKAKRLIGFMVLFLAFTTLLTCYQLIGSNVLAAFSAKRPVVWLGLVKPWEKPDLSNEPLRYEEVSVPIVDFNVIAPPDADRLFTVNGTPISPVDKDATVVRFRGV